MRHHLLLAFLGSTVGCLLPGDDCTVDSTIPSQTRSEQGSAAWTDSTCTSDEKDACHLHAPDGTSLLHCAHDASVVGGFLALECTYYRESDASCHSSEDEHHHHHFDTGGIAPPGH